LIILPVNDKLKLPSDKVTNMPQDIAERTFNFSLRIIKLVDSLPKITAAFVIGKQIIRSSTSIDSNIIHARAGISEKDFVNHLKIAIKEAKETKRWIEMLVAANLVKAELCKNLLQENNEIIAILVTMNKNAYYKIKK
jgi:four helix bundle protein